MKTGTKTPLVGDIQNKVLIEFAKRLGITPMELIERNKRNDICDMRYLYFKLRFENHGVNYMAIGREIGRSRVTVKYGIDRINNILHTNQKEVVAKWDKVKDIPIE